MQKFTFIKDIYNIKVDICTVKNLETKQHKLQCKNDHPITCNFENLVKTLMKSLPQPCVNRKYGCKEFLMEENMSQHESKCGFRKVNCAMLNCKNEGLCFSNYLEHVSNVHTIPIIEYRKKLDFSFSISDDFNPSYFVWKAKRLIAFNKNFFEVGLIKDSLVYRWIYFLGFTEEAKKYHYKATLINDKTGDKISFEKQVRPMSETSEFIIESENAFVVPVSTCKKYKKGYFGLDLDEVHYEIELIEESTEKETEDEANGINEKCVICLENTLTIAMKGCGHLVSCHACASKLQKECPICRAPNIGTMKIYFP